MPQNILNLIQKIHSLQFITMDSSDTRVEGWLKMGRVRTYYSDYDNLISLCAVCF